MKRAPEAMVELRRRALVGQEETLDAKDSIINNHSPLPERASLSPENSRKLAQSLRHAQAQKEGRLSNAADRAAASRPRRPELLRPFKQNSCTRDRRSAILETVGPLFAIPLRAADAINSGCLLRPTQLPSCKGYRYGIYQ